MNPSIVQTEATVQHVRISVKKPFAEVCEKIESRLGQFDLPTFFKMISEGTPESVVQSRLKEIEGPLGIMIFNIVDHGALLSFGGKPSQAKQYVVGNPMIALQMTKRNIRAGLYAPLRIYVSGDGQDQTEIEYDLPSSLFGQFHDAEIDQVAKTLDHKLDALTAYALGGIIIKEGIPLAERSF